MTEADILELTYDDTCTVYRPTKGVLASGESTFKKGLEGKAVHSDISCSLSSPSGGKLQHQKPVITSDIDYILFVRPEIDIQKTDTVEVLQQGRKIVVEIGRGKYYSSHNEYPANLVKVKT